MLCIHSIPHKLKIHHKIDSNFFCSKEDIPHISIALCAVQLVFFMRDRICCACFWRNNFRFLLRASLLAIALATCEKVYSNSSTSIPFSSISKPYTFLWVKLHYKSVSNFFCSEGDISHASIT